MSPIADKKKDFCFTNEDNLGITTNSRFICLLGKFVNFMNISLTNKCIQVFSRNY